MLDNYVVLDFETTGFSPTNSRVIEVGAIRVMRGKMESYNTLVNPRCYIPEHITTLVGIDNRMVANAPDIEFVMRDLNIFCSNLPIVAHNLKFDYGFLVANGLSSGLDFTLNGQRRGLCTLNLAKALLPSIKHKLCDLVTFFNIPKPEGNFHRALYDVYMTKMVLDNLVFIANKECKRVEFGRL